MAAFIPSRRNARGQPARFARVREDKKPESSDGFDGSWVAHLDFVPICQEVFDRHLGDRPISLMSGGMTSRSVPRSCWMVSAVPGTQAEAGPRDNVDVGLRSLEAWLGGDGAVGIHNLMEDAATAEISRSQVWQWAHNYVRQVALAHDFADFLPLPAYAMVD